MRPDQIRGWIFKLYELHRQVSQDKNLLLKPPLISVDDLGSKILGLWDKEKRLISLSETLLEKAPYYQIEDVLKHEMAHQYVDEVLCRKDNRPHGDLFKLACHSLGIDDKATYEIKETQEKQLSKIEKLLALSTSMNQHEAEAALSKAQELSFKYNVEVIDAKVSEYSIRLLGDIRKRIPSFEWKIMNILSEFYFVKTLKIYHQDETAKGLLWQFEIYGTSHNIDTAEYIYYFLINNSEVIWQDYRKSEGKSVSRLRNAFINGLFDGFRQKLFSEQESLRNKFAVKKLIDPKLEEFYIERNPRISRRSVSYTTGSEVYVDGVKEGRSLKVKPGLKSKSTAKSGLMLIGRKSG